MTDDFILRMTTSPVTTWIIRHVASHLDPILFRASNGRFTSMGVPSMPMLTLTARGRKSGKPRSVHLACLEDDGGFLVVASAMGQARHPAWSHNLDASPEIEVQVQERRFPARARVLRLPGSLPRLLGCFFRRFRFPLSGELGRSPSLYRRHKH